MKKFSLFFVIVINWIFLSNCSLRENTIPLNVMSFNIRYDNPEDGPNSWDKRKEMVVETIEAQEADVIGMQEVLIRQQEYLAAKLSRYETYAVGRDDGKLKGEMGSIFFLKNRFELLDRSTFWLSETPEVIGSKGWNAVLPRIVSWVKLKDLENDQILYFFNTHFSHVGEEARLNSAKLLVERVRYIAGDKPTIISGDFNCTKDSKPYSVITQVHDNQHVLYDSHYISETEHFGGLNSINAFGRPGREAIIDYLFCNSSFKVKSHGILIIKKDSVFVSDHYPVVAEMEFTL